MTRRGDEALRQLVSTVITPMPARVISSSFTFFDLHKLNESVRFVNVAQETRDGGLSAALKRIGDELEATSPAIVIVDSFRSIVQAGTAAATGQLSPQDFVQELAMRLTGWEATTFLVGEYQPSESEDNPVFTRSRTASSGSTRPSIATRWFARFTS